jgi:DNA topoisomerase IB
VADPETLERIRSLAVPPAWRSVWISPDPRGHLQAVGTDAAGRRQYLYHPTWRERRDTEKFDRMVGFARTLPSLRRKVRRDLRLEGMPRERVLACAVRLLDRACFRIGTEEYTEQNGSYGLATLQRSHVRVRNGTAEFDYPGKGGSRQVLAVRDRAVAEVIRRLTRRRTGGPGLLAFQEHRRWTGVRSADINGYIKEHAGDGYSAKDFRTWHGTVLAAVALAAQPTPASRTARVRAIAGSMREVAEYLGNTAAVARTSYVDPRVLDRYRSGWTIAAPLQRLADGPGGLVMRRGIEEAVLDLLEDGPSDTIERAA